MSDCLHCTRDFQANGLQKFCSDACRSGYFAAVKAANPLAEFCRTRGIELKRSGPTGILFGLCPLHEERSSSFFVYPDQHFYCYGCAKNGDIFNLCEAIEGISPLEAAEKLAGGSPPVPVIYAPRKKEEIYSLSQADKHRIAEAAHRLVSDSTLISRLVAKRREWTTEALRGCALETDLGYETDCVLGALRGPATLFAYRNGIKARWKNKTIRWLCGSAAGQLWRQSLLGVRHRRVYVTEGETDCLTLISFGVEEDEESIVLALAGSTILPNPAPFEGRDIVIVPDPDQAGQNAETKLRDLLQPLARSITTVLIREMANG
jgi:hypothetical protein